jgi:MFS family permease
VLVRESVADRRPLATPAEVARLLVGALGLVGFWLNGIGPALPQLQRDLHVSRGTVAFYPSAFAVGLIVLGVTAPRLTAPGRRHFVFALAVLGLSGGAALLSSAVAPLVSLVGALIMGFSAALLIALVPALVSDVRGTQSAGLLSRANAFSSAAGLAAPLLVAGAVALGIGWATGFLVVPLAGAVVLLFYLRRMRLPDAEPPPAPSAARPSAAANAPREDQPDRDEAEPWRSWLSLVLAVSIEFCMVLWAPSYMHSHLGLRTALAAALAGAFLLGMAVGRASVTPITRVTGSDDRTIGIITGVVVSGFVVFWFAHAPWLATVGMLVVGLGVALMYPLTAARYVATAPAGSTRASARAALGSGVAIGVAPFVLATISDATGLHAAYLLVPVLCAVLVLNTWLIHRSTAGSRKVSFE